MCGITAYFGEGNAGEILMESLKRLEYRGYDSAGIAVLSNPGLEVRKDVGEVDEINKKINLEEMGGDIAIGHCRWGTHGEVTRENAHPHKSCDGRFALVHNGIIQNWEELKGGMEGHHFTSETDSEVIAHFIEEEAKNREVEEAIQKFLEVAKGSFAVSLLDSDEEKIYAFKRGSPLALGVGDGELYLGSDLYAFSPYTNQAVFFEDDEYAVIDAKNYVFKDKEGAVVDKSPEEFSWEQEESDRKEFEHYMLKEVKEIPRPLKNLDRSLKGEQKERVENFAGKLADSDRVIFTASGTSYHASLLGVYFLQKVDIEAQTLIASEFKNYERVDENTLVVPVSQSGETKDVLEVIEHSRSKGAEIASITNVPHSTIERKSDVNLRIKAGQEVCVAATKTFTNQLYTFLKILEALDGPEISPTLPEEVGTVVQENEGKVKKLAEELKDKEDIYVIGKGETYPVAREIALKLKEIAYIHAEGMMGGELKHGTLALIEDGTPVISLIPREGSGIVSNVEEVEARGANSIKISPFCGRFKLPQRTDGDFAFFSTVIGFLLTYWTARKKDLPIDKPRNLAKSVTVR
ncbi:MAG: glutamine--fructose-6-phosphate transaminase (isomerizing) [Candidatus Aenigmatarchaeota archaeon]